MKAMILERPGTTLVLKDVPKPQFSENEVLLDVEACAVCRTDLHIVDGELNEPKLPLILGHQIIGRVVETGSAVKMYQKGDRLGVPWLSGTCQHCEYCASERENLCDMAIFTGYKVNGGFAEQCVADPRYCFTIDSTLNAAHTAPLLCGGLIGYRAYKRIQDSKRIGFYGFGSAAHMMTQVARFQEKEVYAFTQPGDQEKQKFALSRGAVWAGDSDTFPPVELDGAVIFAPVGALLPQALRSVKKGGHVVCAGIHMSDIPSFPYSILWGERCVSSIANLTRKDGVEFMQLIAQHPIETDTTTYSLEDANKALNDLREGKIKGTAVLLQSGLNRI